MSNEAMTWVWQREDLKPGPKLVLLAIADYADDRGECFPGIAKTAQRTGMDQRTVIRNLRILEDGEFIETKHRGGAGAGRKSNLYRMKKFMEEKGGANRQIATLPDKGNMTNCQGQSDILTGQHGNLPPYPLDNPKNEPLALAQPPQENTAQSPFERWYKHYPLKKGKAEAVKAWSRSKLDPLADKLIEDIKIRLTKDDLWSRGMGIPYPATYINQQRWTDEITPIKANPGKHFEPRQASHKLVTPPTPKKNNKAVGKQAAAGLKSAIAGRPAQAT